MGKPGAFLDIDRAASKLRPISQRVRDFDPLYEESFGNAAYFPRSGKGIF